jgi:hypothetical protein
MRTLGMEFWKKLAQHRLLDITIAAVALLQVCRIAQILPSRARTWDFNFFYISSRLFLNGDNPYTTKLGALSAQYGFAFDEHHLPYAPYPPGFLCFFAPFAMLPPSIAFAAWVTAEAVSLAVLLWLVRHLLRGRLSSRAWILISLGVLISRVVYWHFNMSMVELTLAAAVLAAYALHQQGKRTAACLTVAATGLVKLYPFLLLPWFLWRSADGHRGRLKNLTITTSFVILMVLITGISLWRDYGYHGLPMGIGSEVGRAYHFSVPMLIINLGYAVYDFSPTPQTARWLWPSGVLAGLAVIACAYWLCDGSDREAEWCLVVTAMLLGIANALGHYFVFLIFPLSVAVVRLNSRPTLGRVIFFGLLLLSLNDVETRSTPFLDHHLYLKIFANDLPLMGMLALAAFFALEIKNSPRRPISKLAPNSALAST